MRIPIVVPETLGQLFLLFGAVGVGVFIGIYLYVVYLT